MYNLTWLSHFFPFIISKKVNKRQRCEKLVRSVGKPYFTSLPKFQILFYIKLTQFILNKHSA